MVRDSVIGTRRARAFRRGGGRFDDVRQLSTSAGARGCAARSWIRTCGCPKDATIGYDLEQDRELYHVTESGIVVVEGHRSTVDVATMLV